jgi:hypothetical protein
MGKRILRGALEVRSAGGGVAGTHAANAITSNMIVEAIRRNMAETP